MPITLNLIERLLKAYPESIAGVKDSSGDWNNTKAMLDRFASSGFDVFAGSETFLLANMRNGGKGCISATANVNPAAIHDLYARWKTEGADALQKRLDAIRATFQKYPDDPCAEGRRGALEQRSRLGTRASAAGRAQRRAIEFADRGSEAARLLDAGTLALAKGGQSPVGLADERRPCIRVTAAVARRLR